MLMGMIDFGLGFMDQAFRISVFRFPHFRFFRFLTPVSRRLTPVPRPSHARLTPSHTRLTPSHARLTPVSRTPHAVPHPSHACLTPIHVEKMFHTFDYPFRIPFTLLKGIQRIARNSIFQMMAAGDGC